jgi:AcrR family transcriptional regulator
VTASSAAELGARGREIVACARALLESEGAGALSMRRIAEGLGIRAPSLYKHVPDKAALEAALISDGFAEMADVFGAVAAGAPPGDGLPALGRAYRAFARDHTHLYRLMTSGALDRHRLAPGVEERAGAPLVAAVGGDVDRARAAWAFAHGMAILEADGRFPPGADLDAAWRRGIDAFTRSEDP